MAVFNRWIACHVKSCINGHKQLKNRNEKKRKKRNNSFPLCSFVNSNRMGSSYWFSVCTAHHTMNGITIYNIKNPSIKIYLLTAFSTCASTVYSTYIIHCTVWHTINTIKALNALNSGTFIFNWYKLRSYKIIVNDDD